MTDVQTRPAVAAPKEQGGVVATLFRFQSVFGLLGVFVAAIIFSPRKDGEILFISADNLANVVRAVSEIGIIAVGMTFVILIGGIDLSVGAVLGLAAVGSAVLMVENDWGFLPSVLLVLVIGLLFGALQGVATAMIGIQSFIVTLAGLQIARGLARIWSGGQGVAIAYGDGPHEAPNSFAILGERTFGGLVPIPVLIFAVVAIAAVVIGGTSLAGGRGSVAGTVAGALLLGVLNNILALNNIDSNIQLLIKGLVIVAAAALQRLRPTS